MPGWYIGHQEVLELRTWLTDVWADSEEEAAALFAAGKGNRYAYVSEKLVEIGPVTDIHYDYNEGMGR